LLSTWGLAKLLEHVGPKRPRSDLRFGASANQLLCRNQGTVQGEGILAPIEKRTSKEDPDFRQGNS
jgi:hypothetical protein